MRLPRKYFAMPPGCFRLMTIFLQYDTLREMSYRNLHNAYFSLPLDTAIDLKRKKCLVVGSMLMHMRTKGWINERIKPSSCTKKGGIPTYIRVWTPTELGILIYLQEFDARN